MSVFHGNTASISHSMRLHRLVEVHRAHHNFIADTHTNRAALGHIARVTVNAEDIQDDMSTCSATLPPPSCVRSAHMVDTVDTDRTLRITFSAMA